MLNRRLELRRTAVMERNLTRLTVFVAIIFTANVIALGFLL